MEQTEQPDMPYPVQKAPSKSAWPLLLGAIIIAVIIGGVVISRQPKKQDVKKDTQTETSSPAPTAQPTIDKATVKIQVQNGTGTPGQASQAVKALTEAGYSADKIKSANADSYDHATTTITSKSNYDAIVSNIKEALKPTFSEISDGSTGLSDDSEFDIVIITGGKLFETPTPSASDSATPSPTP
jgi:hypothetical protein